MPQESCKHTNIIEKPHQTLLVQHLVASNVLCTPRPLQTRLKIPQIYLNDYALEHTRTYPDGIENLRSRVRACFAQKIVVFQPTVLKTAGIA